MNEERILELISGEGVQRLKIEMALRIRARKRH